MGVLGKNGEIPYAYGKIKTETIFDQEKGQFLLVTTGWENNKRVHGCLVHIELIGDKLWIQRDGTEYGIANELLEAGISKENIILGFHPEHIRKYTDFAVK